MKILINMQDKVSSRRMPTAFGEINNVVKFILKINQSNLPLFCQNIRQPSC